MDEDIIIFFGFIILILVVVVGFATGCYIAEKQKINNFQATIQGMDSEQKCVAYCGYLSYKRDKTDFFNDCAKACQGDISG